jgi:hypothetical protein
MRPLEGASNLVRVRRVPVAEVAWVLSVVVHVGLAASVVSVALRPWRSETSAAAPRTAPRGEDVPIEVILPVSVEGDVLSEALVDPKGVAPHASGGDTVARVDDGRRGRGGDETASLRATNLADRDEQLRLSPDLRSRLDRDQRTASLAFDRRSDAGPGVGEGVEVLLLRLPAGTDADGGRRE